jgi:hypothetical protein
VLKAIVEESKNSIATAGRQQPTTLVTRFNLVTIIRASGSYINCCEISDKQQEFIIIKNTWCD